jgi:hypothetical protein
VLVNIGRSQNYEDLDGEQALRQRRMAAKMKDLCHIAGVTDLKGFGTHAFRRRTASSLSRLPGNSWRSGASINVSNLLNGNGPNGRNKPAEKYADASTQDASRARESALPLLQTGDDGTTWIRHGSHPLEMVRTMRDLDALRVLPGATPAALDHAAPDLGVVTNPLLLHISSLSHDELCDALTNDEFGLWVRKESQGWLDRAKRKRSKWNNRSEESRLRNNAHARQKRADLRAQGVQEKGSEESRLKKNEKVCAMATGLSSLSFLLRTRQSRPWGHLLLRFDKVVLNT